MGIVLFGALSLRRLRRAAAFALVIIAGLIVWSYEGDPGEGTYEAVPVTAPRLERGQIIYSVPTTERLLSFAVNIDWGEEFLPGMLELFARHDVQVTFFPTGRWAGIHPETVRQLVAAGHELGNHGYRHDHPKSLGDAALTEHIMQNQSQLRDIAGIETVLYAPPYGEVDERIARIAATTGHWTIMWTVDTIDWQRPAPSVIVQRVVPRVQPGTIVLMHPTEPTLSALPTIIESLLADGWKIVPVGRLIERAMQPHAPDRTEGPAQ